LINSEAIIAWGIAHPWPTPEQIEQDLLLSRAICEIANDDYLGRELAFRGGTALNKLKQTQGRFIRPEISEPAARRQACDTRGAPCHFDKNCSLLIPMILVTDVEQKLCTIDAVVAV
jgi:hypothetical protein